jgi:predicted DNA-binding transcriptional regulator AlpA
VICEAKQTTQWRWLIAPTTLSIVVNSGDIGEIAMNALNVKQASEYTGLSKSSLDKLRVYGGGPLYIKVGARVVYDRFDLDTWLKGKKVANTSQQVAVAS